METDALGKLVDAAKFLHHALSEARPDNDDAIAFAMDRLKAAIAEYERDQKAIIEEIRERRKSGPWTGPFHSGKKRACVVVFDRCGTAVIIDAQSPLIAAALNAYYGSDSQGKDLLNG